MKALKLSMTLAAAGLLALSGSLSAQTNAPASPPVRGAGRGGMSVEARLDQLSKQLELKEDQKAKVKAVLEEENKKRQELASAPAEERRAKFQALRQETTKKMKEILTAEQLTKYEALPQGRGQGGRRNQNGGGTNNAGGGQ